MSALLDSLCGTSRLQECAKSDPPGQQNFSEADLIQADLDYLADQRRRAELRVAETMNLERAYVARRGWAL